MWWISCLLEIASTKEISLSLINLPLGKFLGQGQKAAHILCQNYTGMGSDPVTIIIFFWNLLKWATIVPIILSSSTIQVHAKMAC